MLAIFTFRYLDKLTDFLHSFVATHLRRFESNPNFPVLEFLSLLFKYTFLQPPSERYFSCLDAWRICVDFVSVSAVEEKKKSAQKVVLARYQEAFLALVTEILKRLQHTSGAVPGSMNLDELDDTSLDDDVCIFNENIDSPGHDRIGLHFSSPSQKQNRATTDTMRENNEYWLWPGGSS